MVMSATLMVSGWSARCFENGEELPGDSIATSFVVPIWKGNMAAQVMVGPTLRSGYQVGLKSRSFGMAQQL